MEVATLDIGFIALTVLNVVWTQRRLLCPHHLRTSSIVKIKAILLICRSYLRTSFDVYKTILMIGHVSSFRFLFGAKIVQSCSVCLGFEVTHAYLNFLSVGLVSALSIARVINYKYHAFVNLFALFRVLGISFHKQPYQQIVHASPSADSVYVRVSNC